MKKKSIHRVRTRICRSRMSRTFSHVDEKARFCNRNGNVVSLDALRFREWSGNYIISSFLKAHSNEKAASRIHLIWK